MTNSAPILTPDAVAAQFNLWHLALAPLGAAAWHMVLKAAPWAKANGGLLRGVRNFLWTPASALTPAPGPATLPPSTPPPTAAQPTTPTKGTQ